MANSADPDQLASLQKPTDLDLHCLQRQGISGIGRTRVKTHIQVIIWTCSNLRIDKPSNVGVRIPGLITVRLIHMAPIHVLCWRAAETLSKG